MLPEMYVQRRQNQAQVHRWYMAEDRTFNQPDPDRMEKLRHNED